MRALAATVRAPTHARSPRRSRLKALLVQIDRFQFLFQLPARVRRNISLNEKEKVLRDCKSARRAGVRRQRTAVARRRESAAPRALVANTAV